MGSVHHNSLSNPAPYHFVEPKQAKLTDRIIQVGYNTLFKLTRNIAPTVLAFAAIPIAAYTSGSILLVAVPIIWIAYSTFQAVQLLKEQERIPRYENALKCLESLKLQFANESFENTIEQSQNIEALKKNLNKIKTGIRSYKEAIHPTNRLIAFNVLREADQKLFEYTINYQDTDLILKNHKTAIIRIIKEAEKDIDDELDFQTQYIQELKKNFYN